VRSSTKGRGHTERARLGSLVGSPRKSRADAPPSSGKERASGALWERRTNDDRTVELRLQQYDQRDDRQEPATLVRAR